ncbi:MalK ABC-type sugar transport systems, ATPase components [Rhabdaerophilaceae bacterium]
MANIEIRQVKKFYGKTQVIHDVDLTINNGEFVVILGPSGCGKSTLLRMVAGLESIDAGDISIEGKIVNALEPRERGCAMVFQNYALYPHMTVADNIGYALKVAGLDKATRQAKIAQVAAIVGLGDFLQRKPNELSGGQRQRVAMGRAMIREPKVFLFDEPLSNLDAKLRVQMRMEIRRLHQRLGATSVFVTHDQIEAMTLADRMVVMNQGRIEQVGTPRDLYMRPDTRFVAAFIGSPAMNLMPAEIVRPGVAQLAGGRELAFDATGFDPAVGQKVEIGIRPEDIQLVRQDSSGSIELSVSFMEEMGASRLVHAVLADAEISVMLPHEKTDDMTRLAVHFPSEKLHMFDAGTGKRVAARKSSAAKADKAA